MKSRVPPHDLDAEAAVISAALNDAGARDDAMALIPCASSDSYVGSPGGAPFYSPSHQLVWDALVALSQTGSSIDAVTVAGWLRDRELVQRLDGGIKGLAVLIDATPAVSHVEQHCQRVLDKWRVRKVIAVCQAGAAEGYGDVGEPAEWCDSVEQRLHDASEQGQPSAIVTAQEALTDAFQDLAAAAERGATITGIATGYPDFDEKTAGLHDSDLMIVAARPGMGKTSLVLNMAVNIAAADNGYGAAVFSMEMPRKQIATRLACSEARVDQQRVQLMKLTQDEWGKLQYAGHAISRLPLWIDDTPSMTLLQLRAASRRIIGMAKKKGVKLGLIAVDYLQLMRHDGAKGREQEVSAISRGLKAMAKEFGVPVIALSQLNRAVETRGGKDKRPTLADLRECLAFDEWVYTPSGPARIGSKPDSVCACATNANIVTPAEYVPKKYNTVYAVRTQFGTFKATANHLVLTGTGYKRVRDLAPRRDVVASPLKIAHAERGYIPHGRLLGWMLGNGSFTGTPSLIYRRELHDQVVSAVAKFGVQVRLRRTQKSPNIFDAYLSNGTESGCLPNPLMMWLRDMGLEGRVAHDKSIPARYLGTSDIAHRELLRGLWETDGTVTRGIAKYSTCSETLARQVAWLLHTIGVRSTINVEQDGLRQVVASTCDAANMAPIVSGLESDTIRFGALKYPSPDRVDPAPAIFTELAAEVCGSHRRLQRRKDGTYKAICKRDMLKLVGCDQTGIMSGVLASPYGSMPHVGWGRIWSVDELEGEPRVADLHVPETSNFVTNGVVVHNSGAIEQDADTVVFIYREDYYRALAAKKGDEEYIPSDKGIAELIIAKQRNGPTGKVNVRFTASCTRFDNLAQGQYDDWD